VVVSWNEIASWASIASWFWMELMLLLCPAPDWGMNPEPDEEDVVGAPQLA